MSATRSTRLVLRPRLVLLALLGLLVPAGLWWALRCGEVTTLVLVRHADRDGGRDALTALGVERSRALVHAVEKLAVAAIFHSNTVRARETAAPLARALGLPMVERPAADVAGLLQEISTRHGGERVLVVGHGNTVPQLIRAAGGPELPDIAHAEFDDLFLLDLCRCRLGRAELRRLQYGAPSP